MAEVSDSDGMQQFLQMTKAELVDYLGARGMTTTGGKQALVARAFVAWETGVDLAVKPSTEDLQRQLKLDYDNILRQHGIPDPLLMPSTAWSESVNKWPLVDMEKVFMYLLSTKEYNTDYIGKYKAQKAYSYFTSKFVGTVLWAQVANDPDKCFLSSEVTPSQSVRGDSHKQWILLQNTGEVITSVCSCTAGMSHTCNHVIAVLYKVEYAIANHLNSMSCTETSCLWNKGTQKAIQPRKVEEMDLRSDNAGKKCSSEDRKRKQKEKLQFDPRRDTERTKKPAEVSRFIEGLSKISPQCAFITGLAAQLRPNITTQMPPTLPQFAENCIASNNTLDQAELSLAFSESLLFTEEQCRMLEQSSREQGSSSVWLEHRKGRITGSNVRRVARKIDELLRNKNAATTSLVHSLMSGGQDLSHIPAIQWGKENEHNGLIEFEAAMKVSHQNVKVRPSGLFVKKTLPYIGASPDAIIHCDCHGDATVEVKCPYKLKGMDIFEHFSQTDFLHKDTNGVLKLKEEHEYYFQVQAQLAVTTFDSGYFCVSTVNGKPLIIKIQRNEKFWNDTEQKLVIFFKGYLLQCLLGFRTLSFCPSCDKLCLEPQECKNEGDNSVCCDTCNLWFHWQCQMYSGSNNFICSFCSEATDY